MNPSPRIVALKACLDAQPGAVGAPLPSAKGVTLYKVMGKMFAILTTHPIEGVILKCDPHLAEILRDRYAGVGRRGHLDPRSWISIDLGADVPADEVERLAASAYELVRAKLTRKQRAELEALSP